MYQHESCPTMNHQHPSDGQFNNLNNYTTASAASTYSYQISSLTQEASVDKDQDKKSKKKHRRNSKSISTPDVLRHKIKGAEGQVWTNLSSWTNGRVETIDFGNSRKKDQKKSSSKGSSRRNSVQSSVTEHRVYCDNNNYHYTYNTSANAHHALYYMEQPGQKQQADDPIYSPEDKENDELAWALHNSKISDTPRDIATFTLPSPVSQASSLWSPSPSVQSSNLSSLDSISRWSTVAPTRVPMSSTSSVQSQSSRRHRRGTSLVGSISPSSSASNMTPPASTTSRRSRARASSSPTAVDPNITEHYTILPEKHHTSRTAESNAKELPQYWLANKFEHASHDVDELPPSYSQLSCAQPRRNSIAPSATSRSSSRRPASHRRAHSTLSGGSTGTGQSYLSRKDLTGKAKEEKWVADQAESVLSSHHHSPNYRHHEEYDDDREVEKLRNKYPMYYDF